MIILAATPIGNLGDASRRLIEVLENAEVIAAEDTRTTQRLLQALQITNRPRLIALHDHNEKHKAAELAALAAEQDLVVLSDAGMPTVSDPGYGLVAEAVVQGVTVTAIPGPSAVLMALAISGLPTDRFTFEGFLPRKPGERRTALRAVAAEPRTMVFFESPARLASSLSDMGAAFGPDRRIAVCRELTKFYEEVRRGNAAELAEWAGAGVKGEIVVVVEGASPREISPEDAIAQVQQLVTDGIRLKDACAEVAAATGLSSRDLYQQVLAARSK
ncbi:16S rRNA methyltransferase [Microbacterium sp. CH12i]|uniref:16S rRNA (cytidine(1402)-2'-O)-methyltransferase n=1 Tax=Microbacterium sp. CH12i TaxID=1479651 RepID=UPI0004618998|nr:16S rRNA (cytidine(1402)-2'-O)-methyltransferase [Microbacterium sp. CH12i]KDA06012.1 16S rRNA methyltransferase [Microbacterium sp. CH12i]